MSASSKINDSPGHFMVLQAIARGLDTIDKIATATRKSDDEVRAIIDDLVNQRLANMKEKGRFFGSKETKFTVTETGSSLLGVKQQELRQSQERLQQMYDTGDRQQLHGYMDSNRAWIPFMLMSGIIDALFFVSILSFMGMARSSSEQAAVDSADTEGAASSDTSSGSDTSGTDSTADTEKIIMYEYPPGLFGGGNYKVMRNIAIDYKPGIAYMFKYTAHPGTFSKYLPIAEEMMNSFQLTE